jgi:hypothetical protein
MNQSFRRFLGLGLLGLMLATVVVPATFASPQSKGKKGGKKSGKKGKGAPKKGGRGGSK